MTEPKLGDKITANGKEYAITEIDITEIDCQGLTFTVKLESAKKKWWFNPKYLRVKEKAGKCEHLLGDGWLEVTAEYAEYLRNKPEGDVVELREVEIGDNYFDMSCKMWQFSVSEILEKENTPTMRWCKVKPQGEWVEYDVIKSSARPYQYYIKGYEGGNRGLYKAFSMVGFGGIKYRNEDGTISGWATQTCWIRDGKPCEPVKVRFWEV